ncbi:MAG: DUF1697 domain-containing protein [Actinomycetes bacterium]
MSTYVAFLRGINLGRRNKVAMSDLRALLDKRGYSDVRTHLQSGNAVFTTPKRSVAAVEKEIEAAVADELGLEIRVIVRTAGQLRAVVDADPLGDRATDHSRYLVGFLDKPLPAAAVAHVDPAAYAPEEYAVDGKHLYVWLPAGSHDSRLIRALSEKKLGHVATMRTWRVVTKLAEMAAASPKAATDVKPSTR